MSDGFRTDGRIGSPVVIDCELKGPPETRVFQGDFSLSQSRREGAICIFPLDSGFTLLLKGSGGFPEQHPEEHEEDIAHQHGGYEDL